jgi:branched-chain amino acid transport system substrate-binding protein
VRLTRVLAVTSLALLPLSGTACQAKGTAADTSPIVIGADLELSGVDAAIGTTYSRALELRVDQLNAQGGVDGRRVELSIKDNRSDPAVSLANVNGFTADHSVAGIVMGACSSCVAGAARVVDGAKLPTVTLAPASETVEPVADHRYVFKLGPDAGDSAASLVARLRTAGVKRVAVLTTDDLNGSDAVAAYSGQLAHGSTTVVSQQLFRVSDTDLTQPVHGALSHTPDALVVSAFPAQAALVAKSARDAGYTKQIFFDATAAGDVFLDGPAAGATAGAIMVAPQSLVIDEVIATSPARIARKRWFADYTAKYGAFSGYSTFAADAVTLIVESVDKAGGVVHPKMRDAMESAAFEGMSGQIRFSSTDHSGVLPQALTTVVARAGRWRLLT